MTIQEVCQAIEAEFHTRSWKEMTLPMRLLVIQSCIEEWSGEPEQAAKKIKQREPRKAKPQTPLTQHAFTGEEQ